MIPSPVLQDMIEKRQALGRKTVQTPMQMANPPEMTSHAEAEWQVEHMRLSLFPAENITDRQTWWEDLVGEKPESENTKAKLGQYHFTGTWKNGRLLLSVSPLRVDWFYGINPELAPESFSGIGTFDNTLRDFHGLMARWLKVAPTATRIAFGVVLNQPVESPSQGIERLARFLPKLDLAPQNTSDLQLQINRIRDSEAIPGVRLNRVARWAVQTRQRARIAIGEMMQAVGSVEHLAGACVLELDINNAPDESLAFNEHDLGALFEEMTNRTRQAAFQGDIP